MQARAAIRRSGVAIGAERTVGEAARIMERAGVGALAVVEDGELLGIVTDRDLMTRVLAARRPADARVDSVMSMPVVTIDADDDVNQAFGLFRTHGNRRLPVLEGRRFIGMLSVDDLLINVIGDLVDLVRPVTAEAIFGHRDSPTPAYR